MKTLNLTTWERVQLLRCIPTEAPLSEVKKLLRLVDLLELSDSEKEKVGWQEMTGPSPSGPITRSFSFWGGPKAKLKAEHEWEIAFEDADFELMKQLVESRRDWPTAKESFSLAEKFEQIGG